jgi:SNF2 family DNA or RNA helicase
LRINTQNKKNDDKVKETKKGKAGKTAKRKKATKKISYYVKPENMTLEEWQVALRRQVAREEKFVCRAVDDNMRPGEYAVENAKKQSYKVVYRGAKSPWNYCSCMDFKTSGLGTCKHLEALKMWLGSHKRYRLHRELPPYTSVYLSYTNNRQVRIRIGEEHREEYEALASRYFDSDGVITEKGFEDYAQLLMEGRKISDSFRFYDDAIDFIVEQRERRLREKIITNYSDTDLDQLLYVTLYPYQREGVRFAFTKGKSIIADEMGLGKTIQAIATAELLRKERLVSSVLIVCPTSLKYQWKREIERFAHTEALVIEGGHLKRKVQYGRDFFYKIVSYNSMCNDVKILGSLQTDLLIMDEVQRLKNWKTQISQAARRIRSNYSVVLSGTPLENRLEELYSVMEFADQWCLGPYYKFKDSCIECDETGKVIGYKNLNRVGEQIRQRLIRRTKKGVALQMPTRQDKNLIVPMTKEQMGIHGECEFQVSILVHRWQTMHFLS